MNAPAAFSLDVAASPARVRVSGDWTALSLGGVVRRLSAELRGRRCVFDLADLGRIDTVGAFALLRAGPSDGFDGARDEVRQLLDLVATAGPPPARRTGQGQLSVYRLLTRLGRGVETVAVDLYSTLSFLGRLLTSLGAVIADPRRLRMAAIISLMERAGLDALPIVTITNFFIGATIAFLGASLLAQFGASVFTVELIGVGVLREFGVLITAVLLAGRSASSFAAELGAMKMNQEVDAMQVMGVDPFHALVVPRFLAMLTMTPLLTFAADIAGLAGGGIVTWGVLGLSPAFFLQRLLDNVGVIHFYLGLVKAPVMAVVVASIGCQQGLQVGGDVEQLGRRVTTAVVEAIFSIIVIDALFALIFMELNI